MKRKIRVYVLDDSTTEHEILERYFEPFDFDVKYFTDANRMLNQLTIDKELDAPPDFLVIDYNLSAADNNCLWVLPLSRMKIKDIFVYMENYPLTSEREELYKCGATDIINKDHPELLVRSINKLSERIPEGV